MNAFAFMIHPLEAKDVARKYAFAGRLPDSLIERLLRFLPPVKASEITGICSSSAQVHGWFVACPLTTRQMLTLPPEYVLQRIIKTGQLAEKLGAGILGLGAMTSVVGDAGVTVANNLGIAVTTGNSYTVATAVEATKKAAQLMGIRLPRATAAVIGASGSIGAVCSQMMAPEVHSLVMVARNERRLEQVANKVLEQTGRNVQITSDLPAALRRADIVITVTSAVDTVIPAEALKPGAVICDVARPRDVSRQVAENRDDVLIIEGGLVDVPGDVNFNFNFGYPRGTALACMAETMLLALEGRFEDFTLGREISLGQIEEMAGLARKHGFKLSGFRSFEREITMAEIARIKKQAQRKRAQVAGQS